MAQQLAIEVNKGKEEKTWQELVPKQYHSHARVVLPQLELVIF